jgi:hypothetical protein
MKVESQNSMNYSLSINMKRMHSFLNKFKPCLVGAIALGVTHVASAQSITIGTADPGNGNEFPFGDGLGNNYEQVYNQTDFSGSILINQISFFNTQFNPGASTWAPGTYNFYLSTTSAFGTLTGSDEGANNQLFGSFTLSGMVPSPTITFSGTGFNYNPADGNLLLDIQSTKSGSGFAFLDAMNGDAGTLFNRWYNYSSSTENGTFSDSWGLVTEFGSATTATVPDASSGLGLLSGVCLALGALRRKLA